MSRFRGGRDRTDWAKRARAARRHAANILTVDERDLGNRPGLTRVITPLGDEWSLDGVIVSELVAFRLLAHRKLAPDMEKPDDRSRA